MALEVVAGISPVFGVIGVCSKLAMEICERASTVKILKEDCLKLASLVERVGVHLQSCERELSHESHRWQTSLETLLETLTDCKGLIDDCRKWGKIKSLLCADELVHRFQSYCHRLQLAMSMFFQIENNIGRDEVLAQLYGLRSEMRKAHFENAVTVANSGADVRLTLDRARRDPTAANDLKHQVTSVLSDLGEALSEGELEQELSELKKELEASQELKARQEDYYMQQIVGLIQQQDQDQPKPKEPPQDELSPSQDLLCPITKDLFVEPVILVASGHTYERAAIENWLDRGNITDPLTGQTISHCTLCPNHTVHKLVEEHKDKVGRSSGGIPPRSGSQQGVSDRYKMAPQSELREQPSLADPGPATCQLLVPDQAPVTTSLPQLQVDDVMAGQGSSSSTASPCHTFKAPAPTPTPRSLCNQCRIFMGAHESVGNHDVEVLMHTAAKNHPQCLQVVLDQGAEVEAKDDKGRTALHNACIKNALKAVEVLLSRGARVDAVCVCWMTPLHYAAEKNWPRMAQILLDHGAPVNAKDSRGRTPLLVAQEKRSADVIKVLMAPEVQHGPPHDMRRQSSLMKAVEIGDVNLLQAMLVGGAQVDQVDEQLRTPLHRAVEKNLVTVVQMLLARGPRVDLQDDKGMTPLHYAAKMNNPALARALLDHGSPIDLQDNRGMAPLHVAAAKGCSGVVKELLRYGAKPDTPDSQGGTPLHHAASNNCVGVFLVLLDEGGEVNAVDGQGMTPLHRAAENDAGDLIKVLLNHGSLVDPRDLQGRTPLHIAAEGNSVEAAQVLVDRGASLAMRDSNSMKPLRVAEVHGSEGVRQMLTNLGVHLDRTDKTKVGESTSRRQDFKWLRRKRSPAGC